MAYPYVNYHLGRLLHDESWALCDGPGGRGTQLLERLYAVHGCGWMDGAGLIYAEGVRQRIAHDTEEFAGEPVSARLAVIADCARCAGHPVVGVDVKGTTVYLDSDGVSTEQQLLQRFRSEHRAPSAELYPFDAQAFCDEGFPRDPEMSAQLAELLLNRLGPIPASRLVVEPARNRILAASRYGLRPLSSSQVMDLLRCLHTQAWLAEQERKQDQAIYRVYSRSIMRRGGERRGQNTLDDAVRQRGLSLEEEARLHIISHAVSMPGLVEVEARSGILADMIRLEAASRHHALEIIW